MEIAAKHADITHIEADGIIVNLFEGITSPSGATGAVDSATDGLIARLIASGEITGKLNEITIIHSMGKIPARVIAVAGMGKQQSFSTDRLRSLMAHSCRALRKTSCRTIATILHGVGKDGIEAGVSAQAIVEGSILGLYTFTKHKAKDDTHKDVQSLIVVVSDADRLKEAEDAARKGEILAYATMAARDMVNEPSNYMTPDDMASAAARIAQENNMEFTVLDTAQMKEAGMGALLGVAQGSSQQPKLFMIRYRGNPESVETLGLVGKGITFDSGGISLKPSDGMADMKGDMAGGATVMAALAAIARLKIKINAIAVVAATENLPSGTAIKPGDVLIASNGKTIEVVNTDAEGRLTLADALCYAINQGASRVIDIATLTGACHIALGDFCSGIFSNNQELADMITRAGADAGECMWQMPMHEEYKDLNKSDVADIKNTGGRYGGAITAAQFLSEFVSDIPWVHIDIAGTSDTDRERGYLVKGATGVAVRTLVNLAYALEGK